LDFTSKLPITHDIELLSKTLSREISRESYLTKSTTIDGIPGRDSGSRAKSAKKRPCNRLMFEERPVA
jgi:hypothetical protein